MSSKKQHPTALQPTSFFVPNPGSKMSTRCSSNVTRICIISSPSQRWNACLAADFPWKCLPRPFSKSNPSNARNCCIPSQKMSDSGSINCQLSLYCPLILLGECLGWRDPSSLMGSLLSARLKSGPLKLLRLEGCNENLTAGKVPMSCLRR